MPMTFDYPAISYRTTKMLILTIVVLSTTSGRNCPGSHVHWKQESKHVSKTHKVEDSIKSLTLSSDGEVEIRITGISRQPSGRKLVGGQHQV